MGFCKNYCTWEMRQLWAAIRESSFILRHHSQHGREWLLLFRHVCEEKVEFCFSALHREVSTKDCQDPAKTWKTSTRLCSQTHCRGILVPWLLRFSVMGKYQYSLVLFPFFFLLLLFNTENTFLCYYSRVIPKTFVWSHIDTRHLKNFYRLQVMLVICYWF